MATAGPSVAASTKLSFSSVAVGRTIKSVPSILLEGSIHGSTQLFHQVSLVVFGQPSSLLELLPGPFLNA